MKYIVLIGDGMSDYPIKEKYNKTPLQLSNTPSMDFIAQRGELGLIKTIPDGMPPGSDVANLTVMGYNPSVYYTGRAPIESASIGVNLGKHDVAFRCNLVTLSENTHGLKMEDYSAGHIQTEEARQIINVLKQNLDSTDIAFYPGVSYRHVMVWRNGKDGMLTTPPHDITGKAVEEYLPKGEGSEKIIDIMNKAGAILRLLRVNEEKKQRGQKPANGIWLWGQGRRLKVPTYREKYGVSGAVISAVDLINGLGICAGLEPIAVKGATGYLDTNYEGKAEAALRALESVDFVYLHVEAPDEASHKGVLQEKIQAIEDFDRRVVRIVLEGLRECKEDFRLMVLPDHPTPLSLKTHAADPVPYAMVSSRDLKEKKAESRSFNEHDGERTGMLMENGWEMMDRFIKAME